MATATTWAQPKVASIQLEFERLRLLIRRKDGGEESQLRSAEEMLREHRAQSGASSLDLLADLFRLSEFERDLILMCLASEEDTSLPVPTFASALHLLCITPEQRTAAQASLMPSSALRRFRLVVFGDTAGVPRTHVALTLDERIANYLHGLNHLDETVAQMVRPVPAVPVVGNAQQTVERLVRWVESGAAQESWPVIHFTGPASAGKLAVARAFCAHAGLNLYELDVARLPLPDSANCQSTHGLVQRETLLTQMATYLDLTEVSTADRGAASIVRDWIERSAGVLFVGSEERWTFRRNVMHLAVPRTDVDSQRELWSQSMRPSAESLNGHLNSVVQQFDFGPETIAQAAEAAQLLAKQRASKEVSADDLWSACRDQVGWKLQAMAQRLEPVYTWDDIVLPDDVLRQLREIADQVAARSQVYGEWGFGAKLPRGRGISALFSGPSGTGKTMAAEILANYLQLDLHRIDLAGVVSKYIGETEKNLRGVFDAAEQTGTILFFDEADALFGKRTEVKDSHDRYANIETNYLLQRMEDYRGLAILCTNRRSALDRAFLRRLRFLVDFPPPDADLRRRIWEKVFPSQAPTEALDLEALSRLEVSGGNIRNIALNAAFLAAGAQAPIGMTHVLHAARREYSKIDKLLTEAEFGRYYRTVMT